MTELKDNGTDFDGGYTFDENEDYEVPDWLVEEHLWSMSQGEPLFHPVRRPLRTPRDRGPSREDIADFKRRCLRRVNVTKLHTQRVAARRACRAPRTRRVKRATTTHSSTSSGDPPPPGASGSREPHAVERGGGQ